MKNSLSNTRYPVTEVYPDSPEFRSDINKADIFIFAAGFEQRALRVLSNTSPKNSVIAIVFKNGPAENNEAYKRAETIIDGVKLLEVCVLDLHHCERFDVAIEYSLRAVKEFESGEIVLDISGMPNFAICIAIAKIRHVYPLLKLSLVYTEAAEYFPKRGLYQKIKTMLAQRASDSIPEFLSSKAVSMFLPSIFTGVTLGQNDTCLLVFVGYEPHRTICAIEALNPSKVVLIYGVPARPDLGWRLKLSEIMHQGVCEQTTKAIEKVSTEDLQGTLDLILQYYDHLYDEYTIAVTPINGKLQAVAAVLAWETYPDIQINFPMPAEYLSKQFSIGWGRTFRILLGPSLSARLYAPLFVEAS